MRYLPLTAKDREEMLSTTCAKNIDDLFNSVPEFARLDGPIHNLPNHKSELEVSRIMGKMAAKNTAASNVPFFCGAGAYKHHVPSSVDHLIQRSEFLTTYTPYQPEIAQGTLQTLFEFQTQVARVLAADVANASMYDGSTACAEAVVMAARVTKRKKVIFSGGIHPHYLGAAHSMADSLDIELIALNPAVNSEAEVIKYIDSDTAAVVVSCPNVFGTITDLSEISKAANENGALSIGVFTEIFAFGLIEPMGNMGIDIIVGEGQSIGNSLNFGGPYLGLFATREKFMRQMPGRLAGQTVDAKGNRGFVLTLSTREQHIRREKATSNICTNSGLCALAFTIHMTLLGDIGLEAVASKNHEMAVKTADALSSINGVEVLTDTFFNEFAIKLPKNANEVVNALAKKNILAGVPYSRLNPKAEDFKNILLIAATEITTDEDIKALVNGLKEVL